MKKFRYVIAALAVVAIAAPSIASAETIVIREGGHRHMGGARAEFRGHRDWHPHHDRMMIIKHRRHGY